MDGKQHLSLGDKMGPDGIKRMLDSSGVGAGSSKTKKRKGDSGKGKGKDADAKSKEAERLHVLSSSTGNTMQGKSIFTTPRGLVHHPPLYSAGGARDTVGQSCHSFGYRDEGGQQLPDTKLH